MNIIIISILFIIITILSIIVFKTKGLLILIITIPLYIMYINSNKIINIIKRIKSNDKNNLSERKEVEFVSSNNRKRGVIKEEKKKKMRPRKKAFLEKF